MNSKEALEFINLLLDEKKKPILNELEQSLFLGFWQGNTYKEISTNPSWSEQYLREAGPKLYKKIQEDLGIKVTKKNFKNPIEFRYKQNELTSPPTPLLRGEGSNSNSLPLPRREGGLGGLGLPDRNTIEPNPNFGGREDAIVNPFVPQTGTVDNPQQFFNREREIRRVFEVLNSGSSVALIGEEGMGKSSVLRKICQLAESCLHSPRQSVLLDLNCVNDENE